jgi:large subunit ribosomal protein L24
MIVRAEFSGRGLSPRAVVSALRGEGSISFDDARLPGLAPSAVAAAVEAALKAEPGKLAPTLRQTLAAGLGTASLPVGQASFGLDIADGLARSRPLAIEAGQGRASGTARLDLRTLKLDSQWRLEANTPGGDAGAKALPAVVVSYRALIATPGAAELQIDTAALEQELAARKIERDMEELERLRKLNEADHLRSKAPVPATPAEGPPASPGTPVIPPFGHEVRPGTPG